MAHRLSHCFFMVVPGMAASLFLFQCPGGVATADGAGATPATSEKVQFNGDVRPILSENCFFCHGPDKAKRKADMRLDVARRRHRPRRDRPRRARAKRNCDADLQQRSEADHAPARLP